MIPSNLGSEIAFIQEIRGSWMIGVNFLMEGRLLVQELVLTGRERVNLHLYMESSSRPSGCACYKTTGCQRYMLAFSVVA